MYLIRGGGGTHIFGQTGMCRSNGSLFYKKSLNMGPVFYKKILKHGSTFLTEPKFSGFRVAKTPYIAKYLKNWPIFLRKILKDGYPFLPKPPLKMGRGFEAREAHPYPTQIWVPPWVFNRLTYNGQSTIDMGPLTVPLTADLPRCLPLQRFVHHVHYTLSKNCNNCAFLFNAVYWR